MIATELTYVTPDGTVGTAHTYGKAFKNVDELQVLGWVWRHLRNQPQNGEVLTVQVSSSMPSDARVNFLSPRGQIVYAIHLSNCSMAQLEALKASATPEGLHAVAQQLSYIERPKKKLDSDNSARDSDAAPIHEANQADQSVAA